MGNTQNSPMKGRSRMLVEDPAASRRNMAIVPQHSSDEEKTGVLDLPVDSIVKSVLQKFIDRAAFGKRKYGTDLDRTDLDVGDWIQHAQEELMDAILYLEKLKTVSTKTQSDGLYLISAVVQER